jgi:hypothetical protein
MSATYLNPYPFFFSSYKPCGEHGALTRLLFYSLFIFVAYARAYPYPILALLHNVHTLWWEETVYSSYHMIGDIQLTA